MNTRLLGLACLLLFTAAAFAQQTGAIIGTVTDEEGEFLPGVVIQAESSVLPLPRESVTNANGSYRMPLLPPGEYTLTATMTGMATAKRNVRVSLDQTVRVNLTMAPTTVEELTVVAQTPLVSTSDTAVSNAIQSETFENLPVGEEYRDLVRLAPGIQVTADSVRGPSAGGSGQDNIYKFDGVDVSLPLFGTLSAEPSTHDIAQVSIIKGGAQATNFNRSGGFTINSVSKSGTDTYQGELEYRYQDDSWVADSEVPPTALSGTRDLNWLSVNYGGPIVRERLYFYASYFAPQTETTNRTNAYGAQPDGNNDRDEYFLKLTYSPTPNFTLHGSVRDSDRVFENESVGNLTAPTAATNSESEQNITILEGNWIINSSSSFSFKYSDFNLDTSSLPSAILGVQSSTTLGSTIDLNNLDQAGLLEVPEIGDSNADIANLLNPYIQRFGYIGAGGDRVGGGFVGRQNLINRQDFARQDIQLNYDHFFTTGAWEHDFHIGFRHEVAEEDLARRSNGWGSLTFGDSEAEFLFADFLTGDGRAIHSEFESDNIEINNNMTYGNWNINVGFLFSNDKLYGQGLAEDSSNVSGFRLAPGNKYLMYETDFQDMIQPRIGAIYNLGDRTTVYGSIAKYYPPATSLPRAASWDRNILGVRNIGTFNSAGELVDVTQVSSSSGKFFQEDMTPRNVDEILLGYNSTYANGWTAKFYTRYRQAESFWEDVNNNARIAYAETATSGDPEEIASRGLYIPELGTFRDEIGGSSYVIAELEDTETKYYEATVDVEKAGQNYYFKGTYTWSHYYGNFDQDNATSAPDQNIFIGSSLLNDGGGRQQWDNKWGNLAGDRRHLVKVFGTYKFDFGTSIGALVFYQSGAPWEAWNRDVYDSVLPSWDTSDTIRFAEPAGSRTTPSHFQIDFNVNHYFQISGRYRLGLDFDIFNLTDNQTERAFQQDFRRSTFGQATRYWPERRYRLAANFRF